MWSEGISGPNKLWNVLRPLVSVWTINQPSPLRTMSFLVREERCSVEPANRNKDGGDGALSRNVEAFQIKERDLYSTVSHQSVQTSFFLLVEQMTIF